ncbi:glutathione S-transferase family protein [Leptolyngbya sp. AN02str]|uniref:glutathione S-transferase family protein n=1 Tax=Leptolyngbya sp. AN02str TaxID=3423363 RepID=UPI003D31F3E3
MAPLVLIIGNKNYSSWSLRPWLAMQHFGVAFEEVRIPLDTPQTQEQLRHYSPSLKVPVLRHGELVIWESIAILEYLAELFPEYSWYPKDATARAIARCVSAEMHAGFMPLRTHMPMDFRSRYPGQGRTPQVLQDIDRVCQIWRECRDQFGAQGSFLFGELGIADAMYAPVVTRFLTYGVELDATCQDYAEAMLALPAMQTWLAAAEAEVEVIHH